MNEKKKLKMQAGRSESTLICVTEKPKSMNEWNRMKWSEKKNIPKKRYTMTHGILESHKIGCIVFILKKHFWLHFSSFFPLPHAFQFSEAVQNMYIELVFCRTVLFPVAAVAVMTQPYSNSKNNNKICTHQPLFLTHNLSLSASFGYLCLCIYVSVNCNCVFHSFHALYHFVFQKQSVLVQTLPNRSPKWDQANVKCWPSHNSRSRSIVHMLIIQHSIEWCTLKRTNYSSVFYCYFLIEYATRIHRKQK